MIEYRVCWTASSNASFKGASDWAPWEDEGATPEQVEDALDPGAATGRGLAEALEVSGFEWWMETRDA